jgi:hypothetical protein
MSSTISVVSNIPDVVDIFAALSANCLVEVIVTANVVPGIVELLSTTTVSVLDTISELTLGINEYLSSSIDVYSTIDALSPINMQWLDTTVFVDSNVSDLKILIGEYTSSVSSTSTSFADLSIFNIEVLVGTTTISTDVKSDLFIGEPVFVSSTINVESFIPLVSTVTGITSTSIIQSDVADSILLLGAADSLTSIVKITTDVENILTLGVATPLTSTGNVISLSNSVLILSNFRGKSYSETEIWGTLTLGVAEHFESGSSYGQSVVNCDGLVIGAIDLNVDYAITTTADANLSVGSIMSAISLISSNIIVDLSVGGVTPLEHSAIIDTNVNDSELELGTTEPLNSNIFIESFVDGFIYTGVEYGIRSDVDIQSLVGEADLFIGDNSQLNSQVHANSLFITPYLMKGVIEELSATVQIQTSLAPLNVLLGGTDLLSSSIFSISITDAEMILGTDTGLTATTLAESSSSGHFLLGTTEILSATGLITSYTGLDDDLYIGIAIVGHTVYTSNIPQVGIIVGSQEPLSATSLIRTSTNAEYITGKLEPLIGNVSFSTKASCSINVGYAEHLSGSVIFSINIYDLYCWGIVEVLTSSVDIKTKSDTFLNLGIANPLASSVNIVQTTTSSDLIIGLVEVLSATTAPWVESNSDTLWLEIEHIANIVIQSSIPDVAITMGHLDNSLSSTVVIRTVSTIDPMYLGEDEILSANSYVRVVVATELSMGIVNEVLEASINLSTISKIETELDINTQDLLRRKITADLQYWYDYFVVNHKSLNKHQITFPSAGNIYEGSFIELLFNDNYDKTTYRYMYREVLDKTSWPAAIKQRMMLDPDTAHYYIADGDDPNEYNINVYNIQSHDIIMMDRLLVYRLEPENATLIGIDYDILDTSLAKMIYIYLELKINGDYSKYDNEAIFTRKLKSLETCYETYLTQNIFEHVSNKGT